MDTQLTVLEQKSLSIVDQAKIFEVTGSDTRIEAVERVKGIKALEKEIRSVLDPIVDKAFQVHKEATGQRKKLLDPLAEGEWIYKSKAITYDTEQERIRREGELRLQEIARKAEEERMLREATELEAQGMSEEAIEVISAPVEPPPVIANSYQPKSQGESTRVTWDFEIVDRDKIRSQFMVPDVVAIRKLVTALGKNAESVIGGIRVIKKKTMAVKI